MSTCSPIFYEDESPYSKMQSVFSTMEAVVYSGLESPYSSIFQPFDKLCGTGISRYMFEDGVFYQFEDGTNFIFE